MLRNRRVGIPALVMAVVLAISRVAVGIHYPGDVLGGALLGTAAALLLWQPPVRRKLNALANGAGALYDRVGDRVLRRRPHPAA